MCTSSTATPLHLYIKVGVYCSSKSTVNQRGGRSQLTGNTLYQFRKGQRWREGSGCSGSEDKGPTRHSSELLLSTGNPGCWRIYRRFSPGEVSGLSYYAVSQNHSKPPVTESRAESANSSKTKCEMVLFSSRKEENSWAFETQTSKGRSWRNPPPVGSRTQH